MRVLLVFGDDLLLQAVALAFQHGGFTPRSELTLRGAQSAIAEWSPDLIVVDMALGSGAAMQVIDEARSHPSVGVIALARRGELSEAVQVLDRGADDYITIPFVPGDLIARARAVLRRIHPRPLESVADQLIGDLRVSLSGRVMVPGGAEVRLTSLDQALLYLLAANAGRTLTRGEILDAIWGADFVAQSNLVDKRVRALRQKLGDDRQRPRYIETVVGVGYRFVIEPGTD